MAILNQNGLTSELIVNIFSTMAFCCLGGLTAFAVSDEYKNGFM